ncbi:MAG: GtrA family protein, partial [Candidatus Omnitrophota bacterium]|nr:GtrA family protein [Candidatus Omnitrophota bacterium]
MIIKKFFLKIDINTRKEFIRFFISGTIVNATDFSIYYILIQILPFSASKGISFVCAGTVGYLLYKYWAFKRYQRSYVEFGRYILINFLALGINVVTNQYVLEFWPGAVFVALVIATALTALFAFICFKWWVFRILLKKGVYFMWWKWVPWKFLVRDVARRQGLLDPIKVFSQLQNFAQPSEITAPMELLRSGVVLHVRGLINSVAIQHNLDWIWPYWVECQYNPLNDAFIPRSFSLTQINLTHRNWTALGVPDGIEFPIVDPRGLVTPFYDGWSLDVWIIPDEGEPLIPSRLPAGQAGTPKISQNMVVNDNLCVITESNLGQLKLQLKAQVIGSAEAPLCQVRITGSSSVKARIAITLRPYNPEGVSFVNNIVLLENSLGWQINRENFVYFYRPPDHCVFSDYHRGDVYSRLSCNPTDKPVVPSLSSSGVPACRQAGNPEQVPTPETVVRVEVSKEIELEVSCKVGMASAAALYTLEAGRLEEITISVPLTKSKIEFPKGEGASAGPGGLHKEFYLGYQETARLAWKKSLEGAVGLQIPDKQMHFLYEAAIYTMVLHSPKEVYPGPYIYRRFWFRDAAFILYAMLCVGLKERVRRALDCFPSRQTVQGYFLSQEGEW